MNIQEIYTKLKEKDFIEIADIIYIALTNSNDEKVLNELREEREKILKDLNL